MGTNDDGKSSAYSTQEYLRMTLLNPVSLLGEILVLLGIVLVSLSTPESGLIDTPMLGGAFLLVGVITFAFGYTRVQRTLGGRNNE